MAIDYLIRLIDKANQLLVKQISLLNCRKHVYQENFTLTIIWVDINIKLDLQYFASISEIDKLSYK